MTARNRSFWSQVLLTLSIAAPLALAEGQWLFFGVAVLGAAWGWRTRIRGKGASLSGRAGRWLIIASFCWLVIEYFYIVTIPVLALSHFMIIVCAVKLAQGPALRDDAQVYVLTLLLLVVAAIVSGNVMFPAVLLVYLLVGLGSLARFHLDIEHARTRIHNLAIAGGSIAEPPEPAETSGHEPAPRAAVAGAAAVALAVGVVAFVAFPRVGTGLFGRFDARGGAASVTAFSTSLDFGGIGTLQESERPVMRVQFRTGDGRVFMPDEEPYLRGVTLESYGYRSAHGGRWEWRNHSAEPAIKRTFLGFAIDLDEEEDMSLLDLPRDLPRREQIVQEVWMESPGGLCLFSGYPPLLLRARNMSTVRKRVTDQTLQVPPSRRKAIHYTLLLPDRVDESLAAALAEERSERGVPEPRVEPLDMPLPRQREIMDLIAARTVDLPPPDGSGQRTMDFARRLEAFLRSPAFAYSLELTAHHPDEEPLGDFLLDRRKGNCEYFAASMALMCQLSGIPARVVNGYRGGDYNSVGGFYMVREKHAHSWVEVFVPGRDWVRFDPTPSSPSSSSMFSLWLLRGRNYLDFLQFKWSSTVVAFDAEARQDMFRRFSEWVLRPAQNQQTLVGAVAAFVRELFSARLDLTIQERLIYWVFALLVLALVILVGYVVVVGLWWLGRKLYRLIGGAAGGQRRAETEFYHRFQRHMSTLGLRRLGGQTPAEFAADLAGRFPALVGAVTLVQGYYQVAFGGKSLSDGQRGAIERFLAEVGELDAHRFHTAAAGGEPVTAP